MRDNVGALKARLRGGFPRFGEADAHRINVPTLLVTGENSAAVLHRITDRLEHWLPRAERLIIRNSSHLMYEDSPEAFNNGALAFLARHRNVPVRQ